MLRIHKKHLMNGLVSGLVTGLLFGIVLAERGHLWQVGAFIGLPYETAGFIFYLILSGLLGIVFAFLCQKLIYNMVHGVVFGGVYGLVLWILGPIILIPFIHKHFMHESLLRQMGTSVSSFFDESKTNTILGSEKIWSLENLEIAIHCLLFYLIFGVVLGVIYSLLRKMFVGK